MLSVIDPMAALMARALSSSVVSVAEICSVERAEVDANCLTSLATTVNPSPADPARAASMVALRASSLVWSDTPLMSWAIVPTCWRLSAKVAST